MPLPEPKILDVTVRDGGYLINHQYSPELVANIARGLSKAGIQYAEISHGVSIGGKMMGLPALVDDEELMVAAKTAAPDLKISAFISALDFALPLIPALVDFFEIGRVGTNVDEVDKAKKVVKKLKKYDKIVSCQLVRTHGRSPEIAGEAARIAEDMGADIIYVVDSYGSMTPKDVKEYISAVQSNTKAEIGFHGHNHIGLAVSNAITAWESGATWLDASLMGIGRSPGNTILEALVQVLQMEGYRKEVNVAKLCETTEKVMMPIFHHTPFPSMADLLLSAEKLDYSHPELLQIFAGMLHISLEEFIFSIHNKVRDGLFIGNEHLEAVFEKAGIDFKQVTASLEGTPEKK